MLRDHIRRKITLGTALTAGVLSVGIPPAADAAYNFCGPGNMGGNYYCNFGYDVPIAYIEASANTGSYAVYRATASYAGAPSASGTEYYTGTGYVYQNFHCYPGYPASHNRHSYTIYVNYTIADNCI
jgi:hypothetical protein